MCATDKRKSLPLILAILAIFVFLTGMNTSFAEERQVFQQPQICVDHFSQQYTVGGQTFHIELKCTKGKRPNNDHLIITTSLTVAQIEHVIKLGDTKTATNILRNIERAQSLKNGAIEHNSLLFESSEAEIKYLAIWTYQKIKNLNRDMIAATVAHTTVAREVTGSTDSLAPPSATGVVKEFSSKTHSEPQLFPDSTEEAGPSRRPAIIRAPITVMEGS